MAQVWRRSSLVFLGLLLGPPGPLLLPLWLVVLLVLFLLGVFGVGGTGVVLPLACLGLLLLLLEVLFVLCLDGVLGGVVGVVLPLSCHGLLFLRLEGLFVSGLVDVLGIRGDGVALGFNLLVCDPVGVLGIDSVGFGLVLPVLGFICSVGVNVGVAPLGSGTLAVVSVVDGYPPSPWSREIDKLVASRSRAR